MGIAIRNVAKLSNDRSTEMDDEDDEIDDSAVNTSSDERLLVKHLWLNLKVNLPPLKNSTLIFISLKIKHICQEKKTIFCGQ